MPFYPAPNRTADNLAGANNFRSNYVFALNRRNLMGKLDHNFNAKDRLVARYIYNNDVNRYTSVYPDGGADGRQDSIRRYQYWYGAWTRVARPNLVNDFRFTYGNRAIDYSTKGQGGNFVSKLGLQGVHDDGFPQFSPAGFSSLGASQANRDQFPSEQQQFVDDISWVRGRHSFKFGGEARRSRNVESNFSESTGFSTQPTGMPGVAASGNGLASLLVGFVTSFNQSIQPALDRHAWYLAAFAQDDWAVRKDLTLNVGLRWETDTPLVDAANRLNGFDAQAINPVSRTPGVLKFAGLNGFPSKAYRGDWNNFGPRFGFAWRPLGSASTVVRGCFGIFFAHPFDTGVPTAAALGFNVSSTINSPDSGITPAFLLRRGAPGSPTAPVLNDSFGAVVVGGTAQTAVTYFDQGRRTGYSQQFNFGIERELPGSILIGASYLGNLSRKLPGANLAINQIRPELLGPDHRAQKDRPFPQFSNVSILVPTLAISNYHAALVRFEKRYANGFNVVTSYTFSKFLANNGESTDFSFGSFGPSYSNYYNRRADYGASANDIRHHFVFSSVYELPLGAGKPYLARHPLRYVVGGWAVGNVTTIQSGPPFTVVAQTNTTNAFSAGNLRADVIRNPNLGAEQRTLTRYFDTGAFQQPAIYQFGNQNPGLVRSAGIVNFDFSVMRTFAMRERARLQFRGELFNICNHTNLENPGSTFGAATFGVVSAARDARRIQLGLRLAF